MLVAPLLRRSFINRGGLRAFTLLEVLLSLGVLVVLVLLSFGGVNSYRKNALAAVCVGNLRQIGGAIHLYASEHHGRFPIYVDLTETDPENRTGKGMQWDSQINPYLYNGFPYPFRATSADLARPSVFYCPASKHLESDRPGRSLSYAYNQEMATNVNGTGRLGGIEDPARLLMAVDIHFINDLRKGHSWSTIRGGSRSQPIYIWKTRSRNIDYERHLGSTNIVFADGHVAKRQPTGAEDMGPSAQWPRDVTFRNGE